jgi:signal transduction histidine kinase
MSLRNYLFYLIGGLILLLSALQIAFIFWAQNNFEQQVQTKAQEFSLQMLDMAVDNIEMPDVPVVNNDNKEAITTWQKKFTIETADLISDVTIIANTDQVEHDSKTSSGKLSNNAEKAHELIDLKKIKKTLHASMQKLHKQTEQGTIKLEQVVTKVSSPDHQQWFIKASSNIDNDSAISEFVQIVLLVILASTLLALAFAFWLSGKFSQPMQALSKGFQQLAQGNYVNTVAEQGVEETRQTIRNFNEMKTRLQQLSIIEKNHQQQAHLAELGDVSLGLAHALRNPIHTIGLSVEQLNIDNLTAKQRQHFIDKIQGKIAHIDKTIRALLTLTATGIKRNEQVPIIAVVKDIILEYKANDHHFLTFELDIAADLQLLGCESEIRAILHTLIINACEASHSHQTIIINAQQNSLRIDISVQDQGVGLTDKIKEKLFQPHITNKAEGAGMGLYIAQRLMSLFYSGYISLDQHDIGGCIATASFYAQEHAHEK